MWLSLSLALISSQFREVSMSQFNLVADARVIHAVATSPDTHTVSVWTRWSEGGPNCIGWTLHDDGETVDALGEVECPAAPPSGKRHLFLDTQLLGAPKTLVRVLDAERGSVALAFPRALGVASDEDGSLVGAWHLGDFTLHGVAIGKTDWLLWTRDARSADRLFFVDPQLLSSELGNPLTETVPRMTMASNFGWKKAMPTRAVGPCTLERRGVMVEDDVLLLDWRASSARIEVRAMSGSGEQKVWVVDSAGGTPIAGLEVQRVHFARHGVWRLRIRFPWAVSQLAVNEVNKSSKRLSPVLRALQLHGKNECLLDEMNVLRPLEFTLDPRWR